MSLLIHLKAFTAFSLLIGLYGCDNKAAESKAKPEVTCQQPLKKDLGDAIEYHTAAGFKMRVPKNMGGMDKPNNKCQLTSGEFNWLWYKGKLHPFWNSAENMNPGTFVKYFVRFRPPEENKVEKFTRPQWQFEQAFRIPGHEHILLLPYADYGDPKLLPSDRSNRRLWRPLLLLENAHDPAGNALPFVCRAGLSYHEVNGDLRVSLKPRTGLSPCMTNVAFADGAGGRLDIYEEDFFNQGAAITNAVMKEITSYIVKE